MDTGDPIEIINGTTVKRVTVESISRGRASVYWPMAGAYDIDLDSGELMCPVMPRTGIYSVDCFTGRVLGTRCSVAAEEFLLLEQLTPGALVHLEHDGGGRVDAQVVDALPSEGTFKVYVQALPGSKQMGRNFRTGWRVAPEALRVIRKQAGLLSRAS